VTEHADEVVAFDRSAHGEDSSALLVCGGVAFHHVEARYQALPFVREIIR